MNTGQFIQVVPNGDFIINTAHIIYLERKYIPGHVAPAESSDITTNPGELPYLIDIGLVRTTITWGFHTKEARDARFEQLRNMMHPVTLPTLPGDLQKAVADSVEYQQVSKPVSEASDKRKSPVTTSGKRTLRGEIIKPTDDLT